MSVHDETWAEALSCALTGRPATLPMPDGFPGAETKAEDGLLYRIVALGTYGLAGTLPDGAGFKARPPSEDEDCPVAAAVLLPSLLREAADFPLARQWVSEADRKGLDVPFECAAPLMEAYRARGIPFPERPFATWVAWRGKRGEEAASAFQTASGADRLRILKAWRREAPGDARDAVAATFADESASARASLVSCLSEGLSGDDEPFLEGLHADRSSEVRAAVAAVLVGLPGSARSKAFGATARGHIRIDARGRLDVTVPDEGPLDEDWLTGQGIACKRPFSARLCALVASAPLDAWDGLAPADWIAAATRARWPDELRAGWAVAARREGDRAWSLALGNSLRDGMGRGFGQMLAPVALGSLSADDWESMATVLIAGCDLEGTMRLLAASPHATWSKDFSYALVSHLRRVAENHARDRWASRVSLDPVALAADPSCAARFSAVADQWESEWMTDMREQVRTLCATLDRRRAIAEAFACP